MTHNHNMERVNMDNVMDVLKFIALVIKYRKARVIDPEKAEELGAQIDKACSEYLNTGFVDEKGN